MVIMATEPYDPARGWSTDTAIIGNGSVPTAEGDGIPTYGCGLLSWALHTPVGGGAAIAGHWYGQMRRGSSDFNWCKIVSGAVASISVATTETELKIRGYDRVAFVASGFAGTSWQLATRVG